MTKRRRVKKKPKKWIAGAISKPGALRSSAKRAGKLRKDGTIDPSWLAVQAKKPGVIGKRARLARTLKRMKKPGRKRK